MTIILSTLSVTRTVFLHEQTQRENKKAHKHTPPPTTLCAGQDLSWFLLFVFSCQHISQNSSHRKHPKSKRKLYIKLKSLKNTNMRTGCLQIKRIREKEGRP